MIKKFSYYFIRVILVVYLASVFLLCFLNMGNVPSMNMEWFGIPKDKVAHFLMFLPFPILMALTFSKRSWSTGKFMLFLLMTAVSGAAAGGGIELLQGLSEYRSCDINDFKADCIGIAVGIALSLCGWAAAKRKRHISIEK